MKRLALSHLVLVVFAAISSRSVGLFAQPIGLQPTGSTHQKTVETSNEPIDTHPAPPWANPAVTPNATSNPLSEAVEPSAEFARPRGRRWYLTAEMEIGALVTTKRSNSRRDIAGSMTIPLRFVIPHDLRGESVFTVALPMPIPGGAAMYVGIGERLLLGNAKWGGPGFRVGVHARAQFSLGVPCRFGAHENCPNIVFSTPRTSESTGTGYAIGSVADLSLDYIGRPIGSINIVGGIHGLLGWMEGFGRSDEDPMLDGIYFGGTLSGGIRF